jgi:ABC-type microcin C transport system permease subunit YejE
MIRDKGELHGISHTFIGATVLGLIAALTGKYLGEFGLRVIREPSHLPISWPVALVTAYIGTYSHVLIDSIMHADITPWMPFNLTNPLYGIISIDALHIGCVTSAAIGGLIYYGTVNKK